MKKFLQKLAIFLLMLILILWTGQTLVDIRIKNRTVNGHDNLDIVKGQHNDMVFMGSSRCLSHFDPSLFEKALKIKAMNLGVDGHSELSMQILRLRDYLQKNSSPRFVVLNFDPLVSAGSMEKNENFVHKNSFARYAYSHSKVNEPFVRYFDFNFAERHIPLYALLRYKLLLDCISLSNIDNWVTNGYEKHDEQWDTIAHPINRNLVSYYFDTSASTLRTIGIGLDSLNSLCIQHNCRLICVQSPIYKAVYDKTHYGLTANLCKTLAIPFFDLNNEEIDNNIDNFYNIDHLNTRGVNEMAATLLADPGFLNVVRGKD